MTHLSYEKLVRDGIPDVIVSKGETPVIRELRDDKEYAVALARKLIEEASEVAAAKNRDAIAKELADLLEVMYAYAEHTNVPWLRVMWERVRRRREVGGFKKRIFLISVKQLGGICVY